MSWSKKLSASLACSIIFILSTGILASTLAQTPTLSPELFPTPPPRSNDTQVSAVMPDIVPPSAPILISPTDGEMVTTARPEFVWRESTDNVAVSHYYLTIDGSLTIDDISTPGSYNLYNLSYNSSLNYYYLTLNYDLTQGSHTWKVTAVDTVDLSTDSATWSFIIDSIAPTFVINQIANQSVSISAQDINTIPGEAIILGNNEPVLQGTGEALSQVQMTVIIPGQDNLSRNFDIDSSGSWSHQLPILPRDKEIILNFIIIDKANHISALQGVKIIIPSRRIMIPIATVTPTPIPGIPYVPTTPPAVISPEVTPGVTPAATPPPDTRPTITPKPDPEPLQITYRPPKEIIHQLLQNLPAPILNITRTPWFQSLMQILGPWLAVITILLPHLVQTILIAREFGPSLSISVLAKIWQAVGTLPYLNRQGWAFDVKLALLEERDDSKPYFNSISNIGVPFAELAVISQTDVEGMPPIIRHGLTDHKGLYLPFDLAPANYRLSLNHPDYNYPTKEKRPMQTAASDFYQAQTMKLIPENLDFSLQIPADPLNEYSLVKIGDRFSRLTKIKLKLADILHYQSWWNLLILIAASVILLFYPSPGNWFVFSLYIGLGAFYKLRNLFMANVSGLVVDEAGDPLPRALVRLHKLEQSERSWAALTNKEGRFCFYLITGKFKLSAAKLGFQQKAGSEQDEIIEIERYWQAKSTAIILKQGRRQNTANIAETLS